MIYILIMVWGLSYDSSSHPRTSVVAEFNSLKACQNAGKEITSYAPVRPNVSICAEKGEKK